MNVAETSAEPTQVFDEFSHFKVICINAEVYVGACKRNIFSYARKKRLVQAIFTHIYMYKRVGDLKTCDFEEQFF